MSPVAITRLPRGYRLETSLRLPAPLTEVFDFFARAENLETITPPRLRFEILTPTPIEMQVGRLIDYRLRLHGIPLRWRSEITVWDPPHRFVDEQRRGPYRWWTHRHTFEADGHATIVHDRVDYGVSGGALIHTVFVARDLRAIFSFRARVLKDIFDSPADTVTPNLTAAASEQIAAI